MSAAATTRAVIKSTDMTPEMQQKAVDLAVVAMHVCSTERDIAAHIKKAFDEAYGAPFHVIVGRNFGSYVTHQAGNFIYFFIDKLAILCFKA